LDDVAGNILRALRKGAGGGDALEQLANTNRLRGDTDLGGSAESAPGGELARAVAGAELACAAMGHAGGFAEKPAGRGLHSSTFHSQPEPFLPV